MRRLGGEVWQRASGITADAGASGLVDRPSRRAPESSEGREARRAGLVAWPAGLDVAGRGLARGQTLRKSMWVMVRGGRLGRCSYQACGFLTKQSGEKCNRVSYGDHSVSGLS